MLRQPRLHRGASRLHGEAQAGVYRNLKALQSRGDKCVASVELRGLTKCYGKLAVVDDISLTIEHGGLVCLLGPSGCGKTTTLRLIAGFLEPSDGEIHVGDRLVSSKAKTLPPEQRK